MRAIVESLRADADALRVKVDAAYGYPRCDRLSGTLVARVPVTCPCTKANAPDPRCSFFTVAELLPLALKDGTYAYPVNEGKPETLAALSPSERASIATVTDDKIDPAASSVAVADAQADATVKP